jgi:hypothetical protein
MVRFRTPGAYLFAVFVTPSSQEMESLGIPGGSRHNQRKCLIMLVVMGGLESSPNTTCANLLAITLLQRDLSITTCMDALGPRRPWMAESGASAAAYL